MEVQIFGSKKSAETRAALRFFAERRIKTHFVDFAVRNPAIGELTRFAHKFGIGGLLDTESRRYQELGWGSARYSDARWLEKLSEEPLALKMPLVRFQQQLTVGAALTVWTSWK